MSEYTRNSENIYFLNDKNIISSIEDGSVSLNPIPSQEVIKDLCSDVYGKIGSTEGRIDGLSSEDAIKNGVGIIISSLSQEKGNIKYGTRQLVSADVQGLTEYVSHSISEITSNSEIPEKKILSNVSQNNGKVSVEYRDLSTSDVNGLNVKINELIDISAKYFNKTFHQDGYVVKSVYQNNGMLSADFTKIGDSYISEDKISQSKIKNLVEDLANISGAYLLTSDFDKTLSSAFNPGPDEKQKFRYEKDTHDFVLDVCGNVQRIGLKSILESHLIKKISVYEDGGVKFIRITFDTEGGDFIDIRVSDLAQVYKAGDGIGISEDLTISAKESIARKAFVESISSEFRTDIDSIKNINWETLKFNGHITNSYRLQESNYISDFFINDMFHTDKVWNGSILDVKFTDNVLSAQTKNDGFRVGNGDYVIIHDHDNRSQTLEISSLVNNKNVFVLKAGVSRYEYENLKETVKNMSTSCFVLSGTEDFKGQTGIDLSSLNGGTLAIVSSYIGGIVGNDTEQRTAYAWKKVVGENDNNGHWEAFNGNYSTDNVYFSQNMRITYQLGKYTISSCGYSDIDCAGKNMTQFFKTAYADRKNPAVTKPKYEFYLNSYTSSKEVGDTYKIPGVNFKYSSGGTYEFNNPKTDTGVVIDAKQVTLSCVNGNKVNSEKMNVGDIIGINSGTDSIKYEDQEVSYGYNLSAHHLSGDIPLDNLGDKCKPEVAIKADEWNGQEITASTQAKFKGYRNCFWGCVPEISAIPVSKMDSTFIRKLKNKDMSKPKDGTLFKIEDGTKQIIFAAPKSDESRNMYGKDAAQQYKGINAIKQTTKVLVGGVGNYSEKDYDIWLWDNGPIGQDEIYIYWE